jgi:hypothetical protein
MSDTDGTAHGTAVKEATKQAEGLLNRAFTHLKECADSNTGVSSFFPLGVNQIDIRVEVHTPDGAGVTVDIKAVGNEPHDDDQFEDYEEDLMFDDE